MRYYIIAGEASGDVHASHLMRAIKQEDAAARFRCFGGDMMAAEGAELVQHYRDLAYMGFWPVIKHLPTILRGMKHCQKDILEWQPDVLILVDYPGFNLKIARFIKQHSTIPVVYYIAPKLWAWKEHRIRDIKRDVDLLLSILPFEVPSDRRRSGGLSEGKPEGCRCIQEREPSRRAAYHRSAARKP